MKRFTFWRNAIVSELYVVEAEHEDAARQQILDGTVDVFSEEFVEWATGDFELEHVEIIDPLYKMVKDYNGMDSI